MFETSKISIALAVCWLQLASPQTPITKKPPTSLGDLRRDNVPGEKLNFLQETKFDFRFAVVDCYVRRDLPGSQQPRHNMRVRRENGKRSEIVASFFYCSRLNFVAIHEIDAF
jgi:hypothetical protein